MTSTLVDLVQELYPDAPDLVERIQGLIDRVRPALEEHRSHFSSLPGEFPLESGDALLVLTGNVSGGTDPEQLQYLLEEVWENTFSAIRLPSVADFSDGAPGELARDYRLMTDLTLDTEGTAEQGLVLLEQLLKDLSRGVQILGLSLSPEGSREGCFIRKVLKEADPGLLLAGDHSRGDDLAWPGGEPRGGREPLGEVLLEAVLKEDTRELQEWILALPQPEGSRTWINQVPLLFRGGEEGFRVDENLPLEQQAQSILSLQTLQCSLAGVPAFVQVPALPNAPDGADGTASDDFRELAGLVLPHLGQLLQIRFGEPAFAPLSPQRVIPADPRLMVLERGGGGDSSILCLQNLSRDSVEFRDRLDKYPWPESGVVEDLLTGDLLFPSREGPLFSFELQPREVLWLRFGASSPGESGPGESGLSG
ncbi:hypothetical protein SAMN05920897_101112 [Alkalispirochaeta americana]|uniref:Maltogenic Amylase, C-terminal domain n=1 Tax=Alkalispirochaeta americana TaxID=159291 RepID=A0A1N6N8A1_9SPIO|nr:hypothetical protein [Alkalispirochaeta americana]SIP88282.1 hypothetical protein SAMN05920897_101112 [Alkalispirochaeta americana]